MRHISLINHFYYRFTTETENILFIILLKNAFYFIKKKGLYFIESAILIYTSLSSILLLVIKEHFFG